MLDDSKRKGRVGDIVFTTGNTSLKARNIQDNSNKVSICIDDQTPPFSFVTVFGIARIHHCKQNELFKWAAKIAERYIGKIMQKHMGEEIVAKVKYLCA